VATAVWLTCLVLYAVSALSLLASDLFAPSVLGNLAIVRIFYLTVLGLIPYGVVWLADRHRTGQASR
jgi:hypothetical protein